MLIKQEPSENFVAESEHHVCEHHKRQPWDKSYAGCGCSSKYSMRRATPEEREENIKRQKEEQERRRKHMADYDAGRLG